MRSFAEVFFSSVTRDWLTLEEAAALLGDQERTRELVAAAQAGELETAGQLAAPSAFVSRSGLARWITAHGRTSDRVGCAMAWAQNVAARALDGSLRVSAVADESVAVCFSVRATAAATTGKGRAFTGTAYRGDVVLDHHRYSPCVFDLATTRFDKIPFPLLLDHETPVGVIDKAVIASDVTISGTLFSDISDAAAQVSRMADAGLPWELSVRIYPARIDTVNAGESVSVNGRRFSGPLSVFRDSRLREVSVVSLGAASTTSLLLH